ncbi:uncharacterized protein LOC127558207 [Antechinus flavipes]|uniref:uncharacterized protein LOC127558207 n=1 Tax=Antechinus flavipes TaxID=38775 RepID=UPI0022354CB1|nr:uncharacterized protein LOC127558207 [Antechinus flavipes]
MDQAQTTRKKKFLNESFTPFKCTPTMQTRKSTGDSQVLGSTEILSRLPASIWNENRFVLRAWALSISILAFLLLLSLFDGRLADIEVTENYKEALGYWTNCQYHSCPDLGKVTVNKHLGMGFMMLALGSEIFCLLFMGFSFRPIFRRIVRCDLVFSILNFTTGVLIFLSMLLFTLECRFLSPIKVTFVVPYYLCWCSSVLQFLSGILCLINYRQTFDVSVSSVSTLSGFHERSPSVFPPLPQIRSPQFRGARKTLRVGRRRTTFQLASHASE